MKEDHYDLCSFETNLWANRLTKKEIRDKAYSNVIAIRGTSDAPGFDACVDAEIRKLESEIM